MTTEPTREDYPLNPEVEKAYSTDQVYEVVRTALTSDPEFLIHEGFMVSVGRRAGDNATKGFSTDADKGKIFCPGPQNEDVRTADQVVRTVLKSTLTCVRHNLNPEMPATKSKKSAEYEERQSALVEAILTFASMSEASDDEVRTALSQLEADFSSFMTRDESTDTERMGNSLNGVVHLVRKLQSQFELSE